MKKLGIIIAKIILGLLETILILVIVINILLILSDKVLKYPYPSIMDYTYLTIDKSDKVLGLNKDDLIILDIRKTFTNNNIVYYRDDDKYKLGKVEEIIVENVKVKNSMGEDNTTKGLVEGTLIYTIKGVGKIINIVFQPLGLLVAIIILTLTSVIQNLINKKNKKENSDKPNFDNMKRYN